MNSNRLKIIVIFFIVLSLQLKSQNFTRNHGNPFVVNYTASRYNAHEQNFDGLQALDGRLYFANFSGILEFNGTKWNKIPMKSGMRVLSVAMNAKGQIFAGGLSDFGFLEYDELGQTHFISLADSVKTTEIGKVVSVVCIASKTYFVAEKQMYVYENKKVKTIKLQGKAQSAFSVAQRLYVFFEPSTQDTKQRELTFYQDSRFLKIPNNFEEELLDIKAMIEFKEDTSVAIITSKQGFYTLKKDAIWRMPVVLNEYLGEHGISSIVPLGANLFAIATNSGGLVLSNRKGEIIQVIDKSSDLQSESINKVFLDKKSAVWLATSNGISKVELSFPISYINNTNSGLEGKVLDILEFNKNIFVATNKGLFYLNYDKFLKIKDLNHACLDILVVDNQLLIATSNGVFVMNDKLNLSKTVIDKFTFNLLQSTENSNIVYAGHSKEISILNINKSVIKLEKTLTNFNGDIRKMIEQNGYLYIEAIPSNVYMYDIENKFITEISTPKGLISLNLNRHQNDIFFSSEKGLFSIDLTKKQLVKFNLQNSDTSSSKIWLHTLFKLSDDEYLMTDGDQRNPFIFTKEKTIRNKNKTVYVTVFKPITDFQVECVFNDKKANKIWLGGKDGILLVNNLLPFNYGADFKTKLARVSSIQSDSMFQISNIANEVIELNFENNSLRFEFSAPVFPAKGQVFYRYFLKGFDKDTSAWTTSTLKDYTNLPDGNYVFVVEAKNEFGIKAQKASLDFYILTPIYRRWWALLLYILAIVLVVRVLFRWRMRAAEAEKEALEEIVKERTQEITESKKHIEEQRDIAYKHRKHILDSISYAQKIQEAVLPSSEYVNSVLFEHFILFKPRDIVSGDFYWVKKVENYVVTVAADCTGHGVPGAFMSLLGNAFLNEIVNSKTVTNAGAILDELRSKVKISLRQEGKTGEQKDGMDISLTIIDFDNLEICFSGAYNPLYIVRPTEIEGESSYEFIQLKADRQPIGIYIKESPFSTQKFKVQKGDSLYSFSDGFADQFGGETGDKFKAKQFKELLMTIQDKTMQEQKDILDRAYIKWKRDLEQIDDVLVMGVKI